MKRFVERVLEQISELDSPLELIPLLEQNEEIAFQTPGPEKRKEFWSHAQVSMPFVKARCVYSTYHSTYKIHILNIVAKKTSIPAWPGPSVSFCGVVALGKLLDFYDRTLKDVTAI